MLKLAGHGLSLPVSQSTIHSWMIKLGCKYDRARQSYYTDGHERPGVVEYRKEYIKLKRKISLRQPVWKCVEKKSLTDADMEAFEKIRETGE